MPAELTKFSNVQFIENRAGLILIVSNHQHLDELSGKSGIISDNLARVILMVGVIPHIFDPDENKWRKTNHRHTFGSNNVTRAHLKYGATQDRRMNYGNQGRTWLSKYCYGYIIIKVDDGELGSVGEITT